MEAVLVVVTQPRSPEHEAAYQKWYTGAHLPDVLAVPGYRYATRFHRSAENPLAPEPIVPQPFLALYYLDVAGPEALQATSDEHMRRIRSGEMRPTDAIHPEMKAEYYAALGPRWGPRPALEPDAVLLVFTDPVSEEVEHEFNRWYSAVHVAEICSIPGFVAGQRFVASDIDMIGRGRPSPPKYLAIYEMKLGDGVTITTAAGELIRRANSGGALMTMSPALDQSSSRAQFYDRISDRVCAP